MADQRKTPAKSAVSGGWAHGPAEAWAFALSLADGSERDRRIAMLTVDNAVELAMKTYLLLPQRQRGGSKLDAEIAAKLGSGHDLTYWDLVHYLQREFGEDWPEEISREELLWWHQVRNGLHHKGNGLVPDSSALKAYLLGADRMLRFLFGDEPVEAALSEQPAARAVVPQLHETPLPGLIMEVDAMIRRIEARVAELPQGADRNHAVPRELFELIERVDEVVIDAALEWDEETRETMSDQRLWLTVDEPVTPEEAISELQQMRFELVLALM